MRQRPDSCLLCTGARFKVRESLRVEAGTGGEVDAKHVLDYVISYEIGFGQPPNRCR